MRQPSGMARNWLTTAAIEAEGKITFEKVS